MTMMLLCVMRKLIYCFQSRSVSQSVGTDYVKNCVSLVHLFQLHRKQCRNENRYNAETQKDVAYRCQH